MHGLSHGRSRHTVCSLPMAGCSLKEDLEPARQHGQQLLDLRLLTRQQEAITGLLIQAKQPFHALLATVFHAQQHLPH